MPAGTPPADMPPTGAPPTAAIREAHELLDSGPSVLRVQQVPALIRAINKRVARRVIISDDYPTGSQAVHDFPVLTRWAPDHIPRAFAQTPGVFVNLTNSRDFTPDEGEQIGADVAAMVKHLASQPRQLRASASTISSSVVRSVGATRLSETPLGRSDCAPIVVNSFGPADLDIVVLGLLEAEANGADMLSRTGLATIALATSPIQKLRVFACAALRSQEPQIFRSIAAVRSGRNSPRSVTLECEY